MKKTYKLHIIYHLSTHKKVVDIKKQKQVRGISLTEETAFKKIRYKVILDVIAQFETKNNGIHRRELNKFLVKNYSKETKKNKLSPNYKKNKKIIKIGYKNEMISQKDKKFADSFFEKNNARNRFMNKLPENFKFDSENGLKRAIERLKDLNLIESKKPKKGYHYLGLTDKGQILTLKDSIKENLEYIDNASLLFQLNKISVEARKLENKVKISPDYKKYGIK